MENKETPPPPLFILDYAFFLFITSFLRDARSYIRFTCRTCKKISTLFQENERRRIFIALHISNVILFEDQDWFSLEDVGRIYKKKYHRHFKTRTGLLLKDFFEKDEAVLAFLNFHPNGESIQAKARDEIEADYRDWCIGIKQGQFQSNTMSPSEK
jgi:hypothetical protein